MEPKTTTSSASSLLSLVGTNKLIKLKCPDGTEKFVRLTAPVRPVASSDSEPNAEKKSTPIVLCSTSKPTINASTVQPFVVAMPCKPSSSTSTTVLSQTPQQQQQQATVWRCGFDGCMAKFEDREDLIAHRAIHAKERLLASEDNVRKIKASIDAKAKSSVESIDLSSGDENEKNVGKFANNNSNKKFMVRKPQNIVACELCGIKYSSVISLQKHLSMAHQIQCETCGKRFKNNMALSSHRTKFHPQPSDRFQCDRCEWYTYCKEAFEAHKSNHDNPEIMFGLSKKKKEMVPKSVPKVEKKEKRVTVVKEVLNRIIQQVVDAEEKSQLGRSRLTTAFQEVIEVDEEPAPKPPPVKWECTFYRCRMEFKTEKKLISHQKKHDLTGLHGCDHCFHYRKTMEGIQKHVREKHPEHYVPPEKPEPSRRSSRVINCKWKINEHSEVVKIDEDQFKPKPRELFFHIENDLFKPKPKKPGDMRGKRGRPSKSTTATTTIQYSDVVTIGDEEATLDNNNEVITIEDNDEVDDIVFDQEAGLSKKARILKKAKFNSNNNNNNNEVIVIEDNDLEFDMNQPGPSGIKQIKSGISNSEPEVMQVEDEVEVQTSLLDSELNQAVSSIQGDFKFSKPGPSGIKKSKGQAKSKAKGNNITNNINNTRKKKNVNVSSARKGRKQQNNNESSSFGMITFSDDDSNDELDLSGLCDEILIDQEEEAKPPKRSKPSKHPRDVNPTEYYQTQLAIAQARLAGQNQSSSAGDQEHDTIIIPSSYYTNESSSANFVRFTGPIQGQVFKSMFNF